MTTNEIGKLCDELREYNRLTAIYNEVSKTPHWLALKTPQDEVNVSDTLRKDIRVVLARRLAEIEIHFDSIKEG